MAETVNLNTATIVSKSGTNVSIFTYYIDEDEFVFIKIHYDNINIGGVDFKEGELEVTKRGYEDISFELANEGKLIIFGSDRVNEFSINSDGELIHNIPE